MKRLWKNGNILSDGFKGRQRVAREDPITLVTDSVTILWEHGSIERWRSCNLDAPREAQLHNDKGSICICKGNREDHSNYKSVRCRGIIACPQICKRKCILTLLSQQQQSAEPPVSVCTKISVTKERRIFYSLLTKILFSYRSTEV